MTSLFVKKLVNAWIVQGISTIFVIGVYRIRFQWRFHRIVRNGRKVGEVGMTVLAWAVTIFLWVIAVAFAVSNVLILLALIHHRKDMEFVLILGMTMVMFAIFAAGATYGALAVGKGL